ncbi:hypothetical protein PISMIDRAFT_317674 [Pisolithus microcarpus 441]|uniref:Uncharacterized protein n=1 Tax=Pisolithus microcarpus 441 TaxID=765257 RepID=A0A0C9ZV28_9AGAM|nr:hypothetical protein PISMIDRAFT_317674 [Pisolithus microcarpus 441]
MLACKLLTLCTVAVCTKHRRDNCPERHLAAKTAALDEEAGGILGVGHGPAVFVGPAN